MWIITKNSGSSPLCSKPRQKFVQTSYALKSNFTGLIFVADSKSHAHSVMPAPKATTYVRHMSVKRTLSWIRHSRSFKVILISQSVLSQERTSNLAGTFAGSIRTKVHSKLWRKGCVGISRDCPIFLRAPIISGMGKATNFKFCTLIHWIDRNKSPLEISGKSTRGRTQDSRKFSGHYI